jgi:hypothetical protein
LKGYLVAQDHIFTFFIPDAIPVIRNDGVDPAAVNDLFYTTVFLLYSTEHAWRLQQDLNGSIFANRVMDIITRQFMSRQLRIFVFQKQEGSSVAGQVHGMAIG